MGRWSEVSGGVWMSTSRQQAEELRLMRLCVCVCARLWLLSRLAEAWSVGPLASRIRRRPPEPEIPGSSPGRNITLMWTPAFPG